VDLYTRIQRENILKSLRDGFEMCLIVFFLKIIFLFKIIFFTFKKKTTNNKLSKTSETHFPRVDSAMVPDSQSFLSLTQTKLFSNSFDVWPIQFPPISCIRVCEPAS